MSDYRDSHLSPTKAPTYEECFRENPYRALIWRLEQQVLEKILTRFCDGKEIRLLDFACGTGRIVRFLEDRVREAVGVDISPGMLEVARAKSRRAEIIEADLTRADILGERQFDLITAFRFFPNAQDSLRIEAIKTLNRHLAPEGCLVFNNHKHSSSLHYRLARLLNRFDPNDRKMNLREGSDLVSQAQLEIAAIYHLGVFPATERHLTLPRELLYGLEKLMSWCGPLKHYARDLIYVCQHRASHDGS